jgi:hypothetical protein
MKFRSVKPKTTFGLLLLLLVICGSSVVAQTETGDDDADIATAWFDLQLKLVQETAGFSPPVASRAFAYTGVALYEAVVPGMQGYQSLAGQLNALDELPPPSPGDEYYWGAVANSALATTTRYLFATATDENKGAIEALYQSFADPVARELDADVFARSVTQGRVVADAIYIWSLTDGGHEAYLTPFRDTYQPPLGDGLWISTPRTTGDPLPALQPYWGNNRPFVLASGNECAPPAPPAYSTDPDSAFYQEALEVYNTTQHLTNRPPSPASGQTIRGRRQRRPDIRSRFSLSFSKRKTQPWNKRRKLTRG